MVRWSHSAWLIDRKSTRLNSSHTEIYTLSLHDALPILPHALAVGGHRARAGVGEADGCESGHGALVAFGMAHRSEEHTSELQSHRDLHSFPTRRSSDLAACPCCRRPPGARGRR